MGQFIEFGQKVPKVGIEKFDCAQGVVVKAQFINYARPYARNIAFDEVNRCYVECTKEMAIKYRLNPQPRYHFLVAAFMTDMNGNILGDKETKVTFLSMSNNQYEHFLTASNNLDAWHGLVTLVKNVKKGKDGQDFSYVEATPASDSAQTFKGMSQALITRLDQLMNDNEMMSTAVQLIDFATGLNEEEYLERLAQNKNQGQSQPKAVASPQPTYSQPQAIPQAPAPNVVQTTTTVPPTQPQSPTTVGVVDVEPVNDLPF